MVAAKQVKIGNWDLKEEGRRKFGNEQCTGCNGCNGCQSDVRRKKEKGEERRKYVYVFNLISSILFKS
ncbi:hypothetical protein QUB05_05735 [Microcoleus sp. F10-C6]|uniref:hypothetical protein n=1 Tax=unclassified Microcoleus TaxID=2642155 RepID=UPI002FD0FDB7